MNIERYLKYTSTQIKCFWPLYVRKIKPNMKWVTFKNNPQDILIESSYRKPDNAKSEYRNLRKKQFISLSKLLLQKEKFRIEIIKY